MNLLETLAIIATPAVLIGSSAYVLGVVVGEARVQKKRDADVDRLLNACSGHPLAARCYESACGLDHRVDSPCKGMPGWRKRRAVS